LSLANRQTGTHDLTKSKGIRGKKEARKNEERVKEVATLEATAKGKMSAGSYPF